MPLPAPHPGDRASLPPLTAPATRVVRVPVPPSMERLTHSSLYQLVRDSWQRAADAGAPCAPAFTTAVRALAVYARAEGVPVIDVLKGVQALMAEHPRATPEICEFARRQLEDAYHRVD